MGITNYEEIEHLIQEEDAQTFMITRVEVKEIFTLIKEAGGNLSSRIRITKIPNDVVHRTG